MSLIFLSLAFYNTVIILKERFKGDLVRGGRGGMREIPF